MLSLIISCQLELIPLNIDTQTLIMVRFYWMVMNTFLLIISSVLMTSVDALTFNLQQLCNTIMPAMFRHNSTMLWEKLKAKRKPLCCCLGVHNQDWGIWGIGMCPTNLSHFTTIFSTHVQFSMQGWLATLLYTCSEAHLSQVVSLIYHVPIYTACSRSHLLYPETYILMSRPDTDPYGCIKNLT